MIQINEFESAPATPDKNPAPAAAPHPPPAPAAPPTPQEMERATQRHQERLARLRAH